MVPCPPVSILWAVRLLGLRLFHLVILSLVLFLITALFCSVHLFLMLPLLVLVSGNFCP